MEDGETPEAALCRELAEELKITVDPAGVEPLTFASFAYEDFHLLMPLYRVVAWSGQPKGLEGQALDWVSPQALRDYPAPPADIPLFDELARRF